MGSDGITPFERREIGRDEWLELYRGARMVRARSVAWANRAAKVPRGYVFSPRELARRFLHALMINEPEERRYFRPDDAMMGYEYIADRRVYALRIVDRDVLTEAIFAWAVAQFILVVVLHTERGLQRDVAQNTFDRHGRPLFRCLGHAGWHFLSWFIAEELVRRWDEVLSDEEHRKARFAALRRRRASVMRSLEQAA